MRIAQIAPLFESVPPRLYGGTERVVHYLTEELVKQGHQVTLFASGDSITSAELVPCTPRALRLDPDVRDSVPHQMLQLDKVRERADDFDVLHFHTDYLHFPLFRAEAGRTLTTLHGRQDLADHLPFYAHFAKMPLVSISDAQRAPLPAQTSWRRSIMACRLTFTRRLSLPRLLSGISRPDFSGERTRPRDRHCARGGIPLKIAAKVDKADEAYFREVVAPMLNGPGVEFIGEINESEKTEFLGQAAALLFPIDWPEPFGLVLIEAMACGTPVLAFRRGSVPEIVEDRHTGRVVSTMEEAVQAIPDVLALDRRSVRARFESAFPLRGWPPII